MKKEENLKKSEDGIQAEAYQWFHNSYPHLRGLLYHVPNGEKRDPITANLLKAKGVVPGIPDLVLHYRKRTYFIEMKKPGGRVSEDQKKIHRVLDSQGFIVWVVDTVKDFKGLITSILEDQTAQFTLGLSKEDYFYRHKVFSYIYSLNDCELVEISEVCEEENRAKFVRFITEFLVEGYDKIEGYNLQFTPDYEAFYVKRFNSKNNVTYKGKTMV